LQQSDQVKEIASPELQRELLLQALTSTSLQGNASQQQAQRQTLTRMGNEYLLQELNTVIVARQIESLDAYLATPRTGRKVRLNATQRRLLWHVYQHWRDLLKASGKETWQQRRVRAVAMVTQSNLYQYYDAVVIDEAQDLDPSMLRLLVNLCKTPGRLFITADANQSIYGSGFTWTDVQGSLRFQGRTGVLRANYRSTSEIGEAAQSYLSDEMMLDSEINDRHYVNTGPLPDVRAVLNSDHEAQLLANYFKKASLTLRLTLGSCAVLCPNERAGQAIAATLRVQNIEANFMSEQDLDLARSGVKVLTLNAAKGLEFPIVALAGFSAGSYPIIPRDASTDERDEILARERRTMFVGMTRAMHALLVVLPKEVKTPLLQGFEGSYWNMR
jgi:superfamily I DNA/RNA helicase